MNTNVRPLHANRDVTREFNHQAASSGQREEKRKFEAKGHDRQLQEAQFGQRLVEIQMMHGGKHAGLIHRRDRYTVTLRHNDGRLCMYFKHAIESIDLTPIGGELPPIDKSFIADGKVAGETGV